jgi:PAS domain S-box-containing protein
MIVNATYDIGTVILSIIVSFLSSYAAITLVARAQKEKMHNNNLSVTFASLISGSGILTMHFIGMLSFNSHTPLSYNLWTIFLSLLIAIFFSLLSHSLFLRSIRKRGVIYLCAILMGLSISITHYAAMGGMHTNITIDYNLIFVILSILISIVFSYLALGYLAPNTNNTLPSKQNYLVAAFLQAAAISGMHYTAMFSMDFHIGHSLSDTENLEFVTISSDELAIWLGIFTLLFFMTILIMAVMDKDIAEKQQKLSKLQYSSLVDHSPHLVISLSLEGIITAVNPKGKEILIDRHDDLVGKSLGVLLDEYQDGELSEFLKKVPEFEQGEHHLAIKTMGGTWIPMAITFIPIIIDQEIHGYFGVGRDISELIQYKNRIKKVQKELLETVRQQQGMIFKFIKYNDQFIHTLGDGELLRKLGLDTRSIIGKTLFDFYPYDMAKEKTEIYQQAWSGKVTHYEGSINGTIYFASLTPIFKDGKVVEVIGSAADITDRKRIEAIQKRNEQWYRNILNVMTETILLYDENDSIIVLNDNVYEMFGMEKETFLRKKISHNEILFLDQSGVPLTQENYPIAHTLMTGEPIKQRVLGIRKDSGNTTWVNASTIMLDPFEDGDTAKVLLTLSDITVQKEQEIKLGESDALRKTILNSLPVGILVEDGDRNIVLANEFFRDLFQVNEPLSEIEGREAMPYHLSLLPNSPEHNQQILDIIQQQDPQEEEVEIADGRTLRRKYVPFYMNGKLKGHLWTFEDNTERIKMIQESISAKEEAVKANYAKSTFLSNMSHELRTPLNSILGFSQLLEFDDGLKDQQRLYVNEILKGGRHLLDLINEVLDLSRIETGRLKVSFKRVKINTLIEDCVNLISPAASKRNITINSELLNCKGSNINTDEVRFRQIILNLLSNAIKYSYDSGTITIACKSENKLLTIHVIDQGIGIPADKLTRIFEPFYRIAYSNIEGAGIGLSLVKQLARLMGGNVGVKSELGKGSDFWISLPLCVSSINQPQLEAKTTHLQITTNKEKTVLYIEDNPWNVELMEQILNRILNVRLIIAWSGKEGIRKVLEEKIDLVLLDIQLPDISGFDVFNQLQSKGLTKKIPVLGISANAMQEDIEKAKASGFNEYMTKPIDIPEFLKKLSQYL